MQLAVEGDPFGKLLQNHDQQGNWNEHGHTAIVKNVHLAWRELYVLLLWPWRTSILAVHCAIGPTDFGQPVPRIADRY